MTEMFFHPEGVYYVKTAVICTFGQHEDIFNYRRKSFCRANLPLSIALLESGKLLLNVNLRCHHLLKEL